MFWRQDKMQWELSQPWTECAEKLRLKALRSRKVKGAGRAPGGEWLGKVREL